MTFFETIGEYQWYLIAATIVIGMVTSAIAWRRVRTIETVADEVATYTAEQFNKTMINIWMGCVGVSVVILILGTAVPAFAG